MPTYNDSEPDRRYLPTEREVALLTLRMVLARQEESGRETTRARVSQATFRKLCGRSRLSTHFELGVQQYLLAAGWALFCVSHTHYALIRCSAVEGWVRISSKRIDQELGLVERGKYDFRDLEHLLLPTESALPDEDDD